MSKKERKEFHECSRKECHRSNTLWKILGKAAAVTGLIFMIATHEFADQASMFEGENLIIRFPGPTCRYYSDPTWCNNVKAEIDETNPNLVVAIHQLDNNHTPVDDSWLKGTFNTLSDGQVGVVIDAAVAPRWRSWQNQPIENEQFGIFEVYETRGDPAIGTYCQHLAEPLIDWCNQQSRYECPRSIDTIGEPELLDILKMSLNDSMNRHEVDVAFPAEARQDDADMQGHLDGVFDPRVDADTALPDENQPLVDSELLNSLPLEGFPVEEAERRKMWSRVPRKARIAIRRLRNMLGHKPKDVMIQNLKGAKADPELALAAKHFKCDACSTSHEGDETHPVSAPPRFEFNHTVTVDVFETHDDEGNRHSWLSIVMGHATIKWFMLLMTVDSPHRANVWKSFHVIGQRGQDGHESYARIVGCAIGEPLAKVSEIEESRSAPPDWRVLTT